MVGEIFPPYEDVGENMVASIDLHARSMSCGKVQGPRPNLPQNVLNQPIRVCSGLISS